MRGEGRLRCCFSGDGSTLDPGPGALNHAKRMGSASEQGEASAPSRSTREHPPPSIHITCTRASRR